MNYLQMVQRLKRESARSGAQPITLVGLAANDQRLADWIADAWLEVQRRFTDWSFMRRTMEGPLLLDQIAYAADEIDPEAITVARWAPETDHYTVRVTAPNEDQPYKLGEMTFEEFQARYLVRTETAGRPKHWCQGLDMKMLVGPAPDVTADVINGIEGYTLTADYFNRPVPLVADENEPDMPSEFHMLLVWRALVEVAAFDAAPEVDTRARRNLKTAWSDLLAHRTPLIQLGTEPLC